MIRNDGVRGLGSIDVRSLDRPDPRRAQPAAIASVASAFPEASYSQDEVGVLLGLQSRVVRKLLGAPHIQKRPLYLPE